MFPWGALIGLAGQAVSSIASAINNKKQQQMADAEAARQQAYYEAKANENPLSRSENQHLLGQYDRSSQQQIENARGVAAIKGMTPEYSLGVQKAVAEGRTNLMGGMAADASARKDYFDQKGEQARHTKSMEDLERKAARQQTYANLAANAFSAAGSIMDAYTSGAAKAAKAPAATTPTVQDQHQFEQNATKVAEVAADRQQKQKLASGGAVATSAPQTGTSDGTAEDNNFMRDIYEYELQNRNGYLLK